MEKSIKSVIIIGENLRRTDGNEKNTSKKIENQEPRFSFFLTVFFLIVIILVIYPLINGLTISLNDEADTLLNGSDFLWPREFTLSNYRSLFARKGMLQSVLITVLWTLAGTAAGLTADILLAYLLSRKHFVL